MYMAKAKSSLALQKKENIFLLTGENGYDLQKFRKNWEDGAQEKYGEYNIVRYDLEEKSVSELLGELLSPPFFGDGRRVFFLESFPPPPPPRPFSEKRKEEFAILIDTLAKLPEECVVILISPTPDKRTSAWKTAEKIIGKVYTFPLWERNRNGIFSLEGLSQASNWAQQKIREFGEELSPASARFLVEYIGGDPWNIAEECQKLALFSQETGEKISLNHIRKLCIPTEEMENFAFGSTVQKGNISDIVTLFEQLVVAESSPLAVFARDILTTFRSILLSRIARDEKLSAEDVGLHPFVFQQSRETALRFEKSDLLHFYDTLKRIDQEIKNGLIPVNSEKTAFFLLEIERALLQLFRLFPKRHS